MESALVRRAIIYNIAYNFVLILRYFVIILILLLQVCEPYIVMIGRWIHEGLLPAAYGVYKHDFFISQHDCSRQEVQIDFLFK